MLLLLTAEFRKLIPSPYSTEALKNCVRVGDSGRWHVDLEADIEAIVSSAAANATTEKPTLSISTKLDKSGKTIFFAGDFETDLILRATFRRLVRRFGIYLPNREAIVSGIIEASSEASPFNVVRCDIKSFYESLDAKPHIERILADTRTSTELKNVLRAIYDTTGLPVSTAPRGLAFSSVIAEMTLRDFDKKIRKSPGIHRFFRYADDILVFSLPHVPVLKIVRAELTSLGLELNKKTEQCSVASQKTSRTAPPSYRHFNYLGYNFRTLENVKSYESRELSVSISQAKLSKRKTRLFYALHAFKKDGDAEILLDRLSYLSVNRSVFKTKHTRGSRRQKIRTGIHYNYARCGFYPSTKHRRKKEEHLAAELVELDVVLKNALFGQNSEFAEGISKLPTATIASLSRVSFAQGFRKRLMKRYSRARVAKICKVWGHD